MNYYSYPLDTKTLLRKKIAIKKELEQRNITWIEKNVAVLGGSTTNEIVDQLELALLHYGIKAKRKNDWLLKPVVFLYLK